MKFDKDMLIGDLLAQAPEKADILMEAGMHCLGCPASQMESLEEACAVHGIDADEICAELNAQLEEYRKWQKTIDFWFDVIKKASDDDF